MSEQTKDFGKKVLAVWRQLSKTVLIALVIWIVMIACLIWNVLSVPVYVVLATGVILFLLLSMRE